MQELLPVIGMLCIFIGLCIWLNADLEDERLEKQLAEEYDDWHTNEHGDNAEKRK